MNLNPSLGNDGRIPGSGPQQQQSSGPQQSQGRAVPIITPQLLASLNPQQLQQFKSHPQFQEIMRNYIQRQQALQQQQQQLQQQQPIPQQQQPIPQQQQPIPQQSLQQQNIQQQQQQQHSAMMNAQRGLGGPVGLAGSSQVHQSPPLARGNTMSMPRRTIPNQQAVYGGSPASATGVIVPQQQIGHGSPHMIDQQSVPAPMGPGGVVNVNSGVNIPVSYRMGSQTSPIVAGGPPPQSVGSIRGVGAMGALGVPVVGGQAHDPNLPISNLPPELPSKIPETLNSDVHEWSNKIRAQGKDVPADVTLYESITRKDGRYLADSVARAQENKELVESLKKDIQSYNTIKQLRMTAINASNKGQFNNSIWGEGYQGYGNGITNTSTKLLLPERDLTDKDINSKVLRNSKKPRNYVPIRLEFDQERDRFKLRDTFLWDLNEEVLSVEAFTRQLIDDYKFVSKQHYDTILSSIKDQINDYQNRPLKTMGELRVPIKLDITINNTQLTDQFEWDVLNYEDNDPEDFAIYMCDELNLPGEFTTAIAHTIREQTQLYHKALTLIGYAFDGTPVHEDEIRNHLLPSLRLVAPGLSVVDDFFSILRNPSNVADYTPSLIKLTQLEVERQEKEIERDSRRKRRHNESELQASSTSRTITSRRIAAHAARGGPVLPDLSDLPKTFRTPAPSSILPGAVDLGVPEVFEYNEIYVNKTQVKNPDYVPPPRPPKPTVVQNNRVKYLHDVNQNRLVVTIRLS